MPTYSAGIPASSLRRAEFDAAPGKRRQRDWADEKRIMNQSKATRKLFNRPPASAWAQVHWSLGRVL